MLIGVFDQRRERLVVSEGAEAGVTDVLGTPSADDRERLSGTHTLPQALAVRLRHRGASAPPHFHPVDQYQIFVHGTGRIGRHQVQPVTVHYTDRDTPYGPIVADSDGDFQYWTLRMQSHTGIRLMPDARHERVELAGRSVVEAFDPLELDTGSVCDVIARHPDGLHAAVLALGGGDPVHEHLEPSSGGQHLLVIRGSIDHGGRLLEGGCVGVLLPGERAPGILAGPDGVLLLALHFPDQSRPPRRSGRARGPEREQAVS